MCKALTFELVAPMYHLIYVTFLIEIINETRAGTASDLKVPMKRKLSLSSLKENFK